MSDAAGGAGDRASEVRVEVATTELGRGAGGVVVGPIWLARGDDAFPEARWSDFPVVVLGAWVPSLRRLSGRGQAAECHFMEGPYHFSVADAGDGTWRIACFERRAQPSVANAVAEWSAVADRFLASALSAARSLLGYCDSRGWWDDDTERLRAAIAFDEPDAER